MKISRRFKNLIENEPANQPDYVWLEHAVCALGSAPCGWSGWIIGAVFKETPERYATETGDKALPCDDSQRCPKCGSTTFRTGHAQRFDLSPNQTPPRTPGVDYEVAVAIEYE